MAALQPDSQESVACAQTTVLPGLSPVTVRDQESHQESDQDAPTVTPQPGGALFVFGLTWEEQATLEAECVVAGELSGSDLTVAKLLEQLREDGGGRRRRNWRRWRRRHRRRWTLGRQWF